MSQTYYPSNPNSLDAEWLRQLRALIMHGHKVMPREKTTYELPQQTVVVDTRQCVLTIPERKLSYQFMAAEALWIITGEDKVATIEPWNKKIADFSDDGVVFAGAYGPRIQAQLKYVLEQLIKDPHTRQAGLTIWKENPPPSKDIPCTVALWFMIRNHQLNVHAFMRSSDVWLGLPYDVFNFSMLAHYVCWLLRERTSNVLLSPGTLYLTMASSHLYAENLPAAGDLNLTVAMRENNGLGGSTYVDETPDELFLTSRLIPYLFELRDSTRGHHLRWWE